ncbi:MAG: PP2C family protein-serine/threonine phosphatase [Anaerolineales bacterium]
MQSFLLVPAISTHVGWQRTRNEDAVGYRYPGDAGQLAQYGAIFVVADGVGSRAGGEQASQQTVEILVQEYYASQAGTVVSRLDQAIQAANEAIYQAAGDSATTLTVAVITGSELTIAHVGDSRAYWVDEQAITPLTADHIAILDPEKPEHARLTRAVGHKPDVRVDFHQQTIQSGGRLVLLSDGVTRYVDQQALYQVVLGAPPDQAVHTLVSRALERGGLDNISAIVVEIGPPFELPSRLQQHVASLNPTVQVTLTRATSQPSLAKMDNTPTYPRGYAQTPPQDTERVPPRQRSMGVFLALAIILLIMGGVLFLIGSSDDASPTAQDSAVEVAPSTETPVPPTLTSTVTFTPTLSPASPTANLPDSPTATWTVSPPSPTPAPLLPTPTLALAEGMQLTFEQAASTYERIADDVVAFALVPNEPYTIVQIHQSITDNRIWYQLQDPESEQNGWISEADLPLYRLQP